MTDSQDVRKRPKRNGFSLTEMLIVVAIALVIATVAIPQVLNGMRNLRLRNSATNVAGLIQQTRQRAVRDNRNYAMLSGLINNQSMVYIDLNNDAQYNRVPPEPMVLLDTDITLNNAAPNLANLQNLVTPAAAMDFRASSGTQANHPAFNPRGWPCLPAGGGGPFGIPSCQITAGAGNPPVGYVYFLRSATMPIDGWAAVTVSPGGRIRTWRCSTNVANNCNWY
jgi:prepilin-type N-terminal cleavage/methylation domain-containing protein